MRTPTLPRRAAETRAPGNAVNLLSPWVLDELRVRALRRRFALGAAAVLVLVVGAWGLQHVSLRGVQGELAAEQATTTSLEQSIGGLAPVRTYVDGVRRRADEVQTSMRTEVSFSRVLIDLQAALPRGLVVDDLSVSLLPTDQAAEAATTATAPAGTPLEGTDAAAEDGAPPAEDLTRGLSGAGCPGPDPFDTTPSIGCVTISGTASDRAAVGTLVQRLSRRNAFVEPFISTTTTTGAGESTGIAGTSGTTPAAVAFSGTVGLTPAVFTGRYDDLPVALGLEEAP